MKNELREISPEELHGILKSHRLWVKSDGAKGSRANLRGADLRWADLSEADLEGAYLPEADLSGTNLSGANLSGANLSGANLSGADLIEADLSEADLREADLSTADLSTTTLGKANLREANLSGADLSGADLSRADLSGADLRGAGLRKADLRKADLITANLSRADLSEANLNETNLSAANLSRAELNRADLREADLSEANLSTATLCRASLCKAELNRADLSEADLSEANLSGAKLRMAILEGTKRYKTRVSRREDLAGAILDNYEGFIFDEDDEERIKAERAQRDATADQAFGTRADGMISFNLPDSYGPAQVGQVLILITFLFEGVRLAMTAPFDSIDDIFNKAMRPELYGAFEDRNALRLSQLTKGSVFGEAVGKGGLTEFIIGLCTIRQGIRTRKAQLQAEEAKARLEKAKTEIAAQELTNHATPGSETPALAAPMECPTPRLLASPEEKRALEMTVKASFGELDHQPERTEAALKVVDQATNSLSLLQQRLGGEFKIDGKNIPLDPPDDEGESGAPLQV